MRRSAFIPSFSFHHSAHQIAVAMIVVSILNQMLGNALLLIPATVVGRLHLWSPLTALLVAVNPLEIIFGALIVYSVGGALEESWGRKRFLRVALGIPLLAELLVVVSALVLPFPYGIAYHGATIIISTVWIAYGLRAAFARQLLNFWGSPLRGETFALIGLGFIVLNGIFAGILVVLPELYAAGLTYLYMYRGGRINFTAVWNRVTLTYYNWKLKRLKQKSGLRIVKGGSDDSDRNDRYH